MTSEPEVEMRHVLRKVVPDSQHADTQTTAAVAESVNSHGRQNEDGKNESVLRYANCFHSK